MSVSFFLLVMLSQWTILTASPIITNVGGGLPASEDNYLNQYSLPNFSEDSTDVDVDQTVEQVETILKANPGLPRLSREEILFLLKNITTEDKLKGKKEEATAENKQESTTKKTILAKEKTKVNQNIDDQPLMIVLPFKGGYSFSEDVSELYTKRPIIRFISPSTGVKGDLSDLRTNLSNHKASEDGSKNKSPVQDEYWQNQAQKLMDDLKKQNEKYSAFIPLKEIEEAGKEIPFKRMPDQIPENLETDFSDSSNSDTQLNEETINTELADPGDAVLPMGLYNEEKVSEKYPFKYLDGSNADSINNEAIQQPSILYEQLPLEPYSKNPDVSSYVSFKPLPIANTPDGLNEPVNLDAILDKFGILETINNGYLPTLDDQNQKAFPSENSDQQFVETDLFPSEMSEILTDLGLARKKERKLSYVPSVKEETITNNDKNINSDSNDSPSFTSTYTYVLANGPDPMSSNEMALVKDDPGSDMIKRQETTTFEPDAEIIPSVSFKLNETAPEAGSTEVPEPTTTSTENSKDTEVSSEAPNLADLENSFGASPADKDPSEAQLPPPRRNGFYYMLDWNSFLEVGDGDTKVNIRFNPKLGDPQRFISVTVP